MRRRNMYFIAKYDTKILPLEKALGKNDLKSSSKAKVLWKTHRIKPGNGLDGYRLHVLVLGDLMGFSSAD